MAQNKRFVFTTKAVEDIVQRQHDGFILQRYENPWLKGEIGVRAHNLPFHFTEDELTEYIRCKSDVTYFAEKYCYIKTETGEQRLLSFEGREYQKRMLNTMIDNRFSIIMASRQVGKCITPLTRVELKRGTQIMEWPIYKLAWKIQTSKGVLDYAKFGLYWLLDKLNKDKN